MCGTEAPGRPNAAEAGRAGGASPEDGSVGVAARLCAGTAALAGPVPGPPSEGGGRLPGVLLPGANSRAPFICMH